MLKMFSLGFLILISTVATGFTQTEHAAAITILKADLAGMQVVAKNADGKEMIFRFTSKTPIGSLAQAGISKNLAGGVGYQFVVRYINQAGEKVATAFDYIGKEGWKTFQGTLLRSDPAARTVEVKTSLGIEGKFFASEQCLVESRYGAKPFNEWIRSEVPQETKMTVRYTVLRNKKVLQLLEYWEPEL